MFGKKLGTAFLVITLFAAIAVTTASADETQQGNDKAFRTEMVSVELFYGGLGNEFTLFVGFTAEDACNEVEESMARARVRERSDGTLTVKTRRIRGIDLFMYEFDGDAFDFIDQTCEAMFDDDPTTQPLQPVAVGKGWVKVKLSGLDSLDDIGGFRVRNTAKGKVTAEDGRSWKVRGHASFQLHEEGFPDGDPADFQSLRVKEIRSAR
ncbi:MAG: hypothetical protein V3V01_20775 [Acidimicrobiales bacterium]